jgi:hypothetical protein
MAGRISSRLKSAVGTRSALSEGRKTVSSPRSESGGDYLQENLPVHPGEALKSDSLPPKSICDLRFAIGDFEPFGALFNRKSQIINRKLVQYILRLP